MSELRIKAELRRKTKPNTPVSFSESEEQYLEQDLDTYASLQHISRWAFEAQYKQTIAAIELT